MAPGSNAAIVTNEIDGVVKAVVCGLVLSRRCASEMRVITMEGASGSITGEVTVFAAATPVGIGAIGFEPTGNAFPLAAGGTCAGASAVFWVWTDGVCDVRCWAAATVLGRTNLSGDTF